MLTLTLLGPHSRYQRGYRVKKHDLAIVWRTIARPGSPGAVFAAEPAGRALLYFDHACVSDGDPRDASGRRRTACSRETRNIALFVAIRFADRKGGLIVATTHTFWHPKHGYERARQVGLIIRELDKFRRRKGAEWQDWDCVLAGDFNDQPDSATYELSTARGALRDVAIEEVSSSMVVHNSVDEKLNYDGRHHERPQALVAITTPLGAVDGVGVEAQTKKALPSSPDNGTASSKETPGQATEDAPASGDGPEDDGEAEEEEGEAEEEAEEHQDRILKNCRPARPSDGLLTLDELCQLYDLSRPPPSSEGGYDPNTHPDARSTLTTRTASSASSPIGLQSTYGSFYNHLKAQGEEQAQEESDGLEAGNFFGSASRGRERWNDDTWTPDSPNSHLGDGHEPMWTLFSPLFSLTLDYIFLFPRISGASSGEQEGGAGESGAAASYPKVTALLRTHRTEVLQPGTPRKFVNASDHVAIGAEIEL